MARDDSEGASIGGLIVGTIAVILLLISAWSSYYTVDQKERGVVLHNGALAGESEPGLHFKYPFVTSVVHVEVSQQNVAFTNKGNNGDFRLQAYTADQQPATLSVNVIYHVTNATEVYARYGDLDHLESVLVAPTAQTWVKNVFGQYNAIDAIQKRTQLSAAVYNALLAHIRGPVVIDSVQVSDIAFSQSYENAVEMRMQAIVAQEQAIAEKQKRITNADAAAYEVKAAADAQAHQTEVEGAAEADAIRKRGDALKENPEMPQLVAAEKWDGHLPQTMVPGSSVPFMNVR